MINMDRAKSFHQLKNQILEDNSEDDPLNA